MRWSTLMGTSMVVAVVALATGCSVNDLPAYRSRMASVQVAPRVDRLGELIFVSPTVVNPSDPSSVAIGTMEGQVRQRLSDRLARMGNPDLVSQRFEASLDSAFDDALPWQRVPASAGPDGLFQVAVDHYGVSVDANGVGLLFFDVSVEARFVETGALIYENTVHTAVPLTQAYEGDDPVASAAARSMNVMALDQLTDEEFQRMVWEGADQAARRLVAELAHDAWD